MLLGHQSNQGRPAPNAYPRPACLGPSALAATRRQGEVNHSRNPKSPPPPPPPGGGRHGRFVWPLITQPSSSFESRCKCSMSSARTLSTAGGQVCSACLHACSLELHFLCARMQNRRWLSGWSAVCRVSGRTRWRRQRRHRLAGALPHGAYRGSVDMRRRSEKPSALYTMGQGLHSVFRNAACGAVCGICLRRSGRHAARQRSGPHLHSQRGHRSHWCRTLHISPTSSHAAREPLSRPRRPPAAARATNACGPEQSRRSSRAWSVGVT